MKRICTLSLAVAALALCLTGCVREDITVTLNSDGTGSVAATVGLLKDVYDQLSELGGSIPFEGKDTFNAEYDGKQYVAFTETKEYSSFADIEKTLSDLTYDTDMFGDMAEDDGDADAGDTAGTDDVIIIDDTDAGTTETDPHIFKSVKIEKSGSKYTFHAVLNALPGQTEGYDMSDALKASITVEMPGKVTDCKGGAVEENKAVFDITDMSHENELYAESKTTSAVPLIIGAAVITAAIAAGAFILLRKRRK